jgi:hypothetical protein
MPKTTAKKSESAKSDTKKTVVEKPKSASKRASEKAAAAPPTHGKGAQEPTPVPPPPETVSVSTAATEGATTEEKPPRTVEPPAEPRARDPRLPKPGTVLEKRDRHGELRCSCTVGKEGIRYAGKVYSSISSAALAAAKDLGLKNRTQNGFIFWGLSKPTAPAKDYMEGVESAWKRYRERVDQLLANCVGDEDRDAVAVALRKHREAFPDLG